jgi:hypothetical protein
MTGFSDRHATGLSDRDDRTRHKVAYFFNGVLFLVVKSLCESCFGGIKKPGASAETAASSRGIQPGSDSFFDQVSLKFSQHPKNLEHKFSPACRCIERF